MGQRRMRILFIALLIIASSALLVVVFAKPFGPERGVDQKEGVEAFDEIKREVKEQGEEYQRELEMKQDAWGNSLPRRPVEDPNPVLPRE